MKKQKRNLFRKLEDIIELGVLQGWMIKKSEIAIDKFLNCARNNNCDSRIELENDLF